VKEFFDFLHEKVGKIVKANSGSFSFTFTMIFLSITDGGASKNRWFYQSFNLVFPFFILNRRTEGYKVKTENIYKMSFL